MVLSTVSWSLLPNPMVVLFIGKLDQFHVVWKKMTSLQVMAMWEVVTPEAMSDMCNRKKEELKFDGEVLNLDQVIAK